MNKFEEPICNILASRFGDFISLEQIYTELKQLVPGLCDNKIQCTWCKMGKHPKWQHQCRWALQILKRRKIVESGKRGFWKLVK